MSVTKISKPGPSTYHVWTQDDFNVADIIDIATSLGRPARFITIESSGGATTIQFNVCEKVFKSQEAVGNTFIPDAAFYTSPQLVDEIVQTRDNIVIESESAQHWEEFAVYDIKIVTKGTIIRITVS